MRRSDDRHYREERDHQLCQSCLPRAMQRIQGSVADDCPARKQNNWSKPAQHPGRVGDFFQTCLSQDQPDCKLGKTNQEKRRSTKDQAGEPEHRTNNTLHLLSRKIEERRRHCVGQRHREEGYKEHRDHRCRKERIEPDIHAECRHQQEVSRHEPEIAQEGDHQNNHP